MTPSEQFIEENEKISFNHAEKICITHQLNVNDFINDKQINDCRMIDTQILFNWLGY